ncbi:MAG: hypothetical protein U0031_18565 [Thermomicrobiales bacterium]
MDGTQFDRLTQHLGQALSRRRFGRLAVVFGLLAGLDVAKPSEAKPKKKKPKPKPCGRGAIRCGRKCVNPLLDPKNCGKCGRACLAGQACVTGSCQDSGCPGNQTSCSGTCVNTQTDSANCGTCGNTCTGGQTCIDGQCIVTGCGANQLDCGNGVCAGGANPCCSYLDCGAGSGDLVCDTTTHQCVCNTAGKGICKRFTNGAGICNVCCGDGSHTCIDDTVCVDIPGTGISTCDCPAGKTRCAGSQNAHKCQSSTGQDNRRCGIGCIDCTEFGPTSFCCFGQCQTACEPNTFCNLQTCGGCQTCGEGTACCRSGSTNLFGCTLLENGRCPGPPP